MARAAMLVGLWTGLWWWSCLGAGAVLAGEPAPPAEANAEGPVADGVGFPLAAPAVPPACRIVAVSDAASLTVRCPKGLQSVRLGFLRPPRPGPPLEGGEPFGDESAELARRLLVGRAVTLPGDGSVLLAGADVRIELLAGGLARLEAGAPEELVRAARAARMGQLGIWSVAAWRRHQAAATQPLDLRGAAAARSRPSLGQVAARLPRPSAEERRRAFEAALAELQKGQEGRDEGGREKPRR